MFTKKTPQKQHFVHTQKNELITYIKYRQVRDCQQTKQGGHSFMLNDSISES